MTQRQLPGASASAALTLRRNTLKMSVKRSGNGLGKYEVGFSFASRCKSKCG
jgi:hypothetical protein